MTDKKKESDVGIIDVSMKERGICMREKFIKFMEGRYGVDAFAKFTMGLHLWQSFCLCLYGIEWVQRVIRWDFWQFFILITECSPEIYRNVMPRIRNIFRSLPV